MVSFIVVDSLVISAESVRGLSWLSEPSATLFLTSVVLSTGATLGWLVASVPFTEIDDSASVFFGCNDAETIVFWESTLVSSA